MHYQLRFVASPPHNDGNAITGPSGFVFSVAHPRLIIATQRMLFDFTTTSNSIHSTVRLPSPIQKIAYVGSPPTILTFLENGHVAAYEDSSSGLELSHQLSIAGTDRAVSFAHGALFGDFAVFSKVDSPSVWCLPVHSNHKLGDPFKLRSDIEGLQDNVKLVDGAIAKIRGKVSTNVRVRPSPIVALSSHAKLPLIAAVFKNGIIRVWDISRREQRMCSDAQLQMGEAIVDIALHPTFPTVVLCTNQGRILSFVIHQSAYKHSDAPAPPTSRAIVRNQIFRCMCFSSVDPPYLFLLTATKRIVVRLVDRAGVIVTSGRYPKVLRPLAFGNGVVSNPSIASSHGDYESFSETDTSEKPRMLTDPTLGLMACALDQSGLVFVFQLWAHNLPIQFVPKSPGLDTSLATSRSDLHLGPVDIASESLIVYNNTVFSYTLGIERLTEACKIPDGDVRSIQVARDKTGCCVGALIFYDGDNIHEATEYNEALQTSRFVLCTRGSMKGDWTVSEPSEGLTGCFLNEVGSHEAAFIVANTGKSVSITSFTGVSFVESAKKQQRRGVQRFQIDDGQIGSVFRTPFASWTAVLYHDVLRKRLSVSSNTFIRNSDAFNLIDTSSLYKMDENTSLALQPNETVIDVRWQVVHGEKLREEECLGAIMTDKRIYIVRNVLEVMSHLEYSTLSRSLTPYSPLSFGWVGASIMLLCGSSLFSISLDGKPDYIAGLGSTENVASLVACLPTRVVYAVPGFGGKERLLYVKSRLYGGISPILRGALSLPQQGSNIEQQKALINHLVEQLDVSQGSPLMAECLTSNGMAAIAYRIVTSDKGKDVMPALKKIDFLARMGDIRGALTVAEREYMRLPSGDAFHEGTELYRKLQRVMNMAFIIGDLNVCKRCSQLLGRRGTFLSFIVAEGGYDALRAALDEMKQHGNRAATEKLKVLADRSFNSSVASDISVFPSRREVRGLRQTIATAQQSNLKLGSRDERKVFLQIIVQQEDDSKGPAVNRAVLETSEARSLSEQLEMFSSKATTNDFRGVQESDYVALVENQEGSQANINPLMKDTAAGNNITDSSDDERQNYGTNKISKDILGEQSSSRNLETMVPTAMGQLTEATEEGMKETQRLLEQQNIKSRAAAQAASEVGKDLVTAQQKSALSGAAAPEAKASELVKKASEKLRDGRVKASLKDIENGVRALVRGVERGIPVEAVVLKELVMYRFVCRLRIAMNEVEGSDLGQTVAGKVVYAQFAMAATRLALRSEDMVDTFVRAADANMLLGNFGTAAASLRMVKEIGVPEDMRESLRQRYSVCQAKGLAESVPLPPRNICFASLKVLPPEIQMLRCNVCIALYAINSGIILGSLCEYCQMGRIVAG